MKTLASTVGHSLQAAVPLGRAFRRISDAFLATVVLALSSPVLAMTALAIWWQNGESPIFRLHRVDGDGRPFELYRFRTMTEERDYRGNLLPDYKRVTPLGRWLYATRIYKLPSLWNVVLGQIEF